MRKYWFLSFCLSCSSLALGDWLEEEEEDFASESIEQDKSWLDDWVVDLSQDIRRNQDEIDTSRSSVTLSYERPLFESSYLKIENRTRYFWSSDRLSEASGDKAYLHNKLNAAWYQYSLDSCSITLGRQTPVWGEVEGTFVVDVISPFDYTENLSTDYAAIRRSQDAAVAVCHLDRYVVDVFGIIDAELDRFAHRDENSQPSTGNEWGFRLKRLWEGGDLSLMHARLYGNTPNVIVNPAFPLTSGQALLYEVEPFDLYGASVSLADGRILYKLDLAYKTDQPVVGSLSLTDTFEYALGFEYTTPSNHRFNAGYWYIDPLDQSDPQRLKHALTAGWSQTYLNDNLSMSLLSSWFDQPLQWINTLEGKYQWDDYWSTTAGVTIGSISDSAMNLPQAQSERSVSFSIAYIF